MPTKIKNVSSKLLWIQEPNGDHRCVAVGKEIDLAVGKLADHAFCNKLKKMGLIQEVQGGERAKDRSSKRANDGS